MNKSEIAELVARKLWLIARGFAPDDGPERLAKMIEIVEMAEIVERAIAESQAPQWISVANKLPPTGEPVLFGWWNMPRNSPVAHYCIEIGVHRSGEGHWEAERTGPQDDPIWFADNSGQVTHWMPLPKPPLSKGNDNVKPDNDNRRDRNLRSGDTSSDSELRNASSVELGDGEPSPLPAKLAEKYAEYRLANRGDTRELKAALKESAYLMSMKGFNELDVDEWDRRAKAIQDLAEKLLG